MTPIDERQKRDPRVDPKPGDILGYRDKQHRTIALVFTAACGEPHVHYAVTSVIKTKAWRKWAKNAEVIHAAE